MVKAKNNWNFFIIKENQFRISKVPVFLAVNKIIVNRKFLALKLQNALAIKPLKI
jgi:hypothetical protein